MNMDEIIVKFKRLSENAIIPTRAHKNADAGMDLYALEDISIAPHTGKLISTGIATSIPKNTVMIIKDKSGLATKFGLESSGGVIDHGYTGEIKGYLFNNSDEVVTIKYGKAFCQLLVIPCWTGEPIEVTELENTERGAGGFGSTNS